MKSGKVEAGWYAVSGNGLFTHSTNINVSGGELISTYVKITAKDTETKYAATDAGDYTATATLAEGNKWTDGTTEPKSIAWSIDKLAIASVTTDAQVTFDGSPATPALTVTAADGSAVPTDCYQVIWAGNTAPGNAVAVVKGIGNYTGVEAVGFTIVKPETQPNLNIAVADIADVVYNGEAQAPEPVVTYVETDEDVETTAYDVEYQRDGNKINASDVKDAGTYTVVVTGNGTDATGTVTKTFNIKKAKLAAIEPIADQAYTGSVITPTPTVDDKVLVAGDDYVLDYDTYDPYYKLDGGGYKQYDSEDQYPLRKTDDFKSAGLIKLTIKGDGKNTLGEALKSDGTQYNYNIWRMGNQMATWAEKPLRTASAADLAKDNVVVDCPVHVAHVTGTVTYAKKAGPTNLQVDSTTGKVAIKKGTKAGKYTITIRAFDKGGHNYAAGSPDPVECTIVVE